MISRRLLGCALALLAGYGCGSKPPALIVGSKESDAQMLLGEIVAQHIERRLGRPVERRLGLGTAKYAHETLLAGQVHLYPEDLGSARAVAFRFESSPDPNITRERTKIEYKNLQLEFMAPLGFENPWVLVVNESFAKAKSITTISDAAKGDQRWLLAAQSEFLSRADGLAAIQRTYSFSWGAAPKSLDSKTAYQLLASGKVSLVAGNLTDPALLAKNFRVLQDDKNAFGPYDQGIVVRAEKLLEFPGLGAALAELTGKFSIATVREWTAKVDETHPVRTVAAEYLRSR